MKIKAFSVLVLAISATFCLNEINPNSPIEVFHYIGKYMSFRSVNLGLGSDSEKSSSKGSFAINFGLKTSIVGSLEQAKWGITCDGSVDNSCSITSTDKYQVFYLSKQLDAQKAELYLRPVFNTTVKVDEPKVEKMPVDLIVGGNSWVLDQLGILGLSPSGYFSKYLTDLYGDNANIVFKYTLEDNTVSNDDLSYNLNTYLNPAYNGTDVMSEFVLDKDAGSWSAKASIDFISPAWSLKDKRACFNTDDMLIQVDDSTDRCDAVKNIICDGKIGPDCTKANAKFDKAPKLQIQFSSNMFEFTPEEYLYYTDKGVVDCRFGDPGNLRVDGSCDSDTELGVGKYFLQKYPAVLKFRYGGQSSIVLLNNFIIPDVPSSNRFIWLIVGGIAALIALVVIVSVILKKKQESDEDYYPAYQNAN